MLRTTRATIAGHRCPPILRWGAISLFLLLSLDVGWSGAQTTLYTWTDEKGVIHYSDLTVPPQHLDKASKVTILPHSSTLPSRAREPESIPLLILNGDPSQKFVRATLQGRRTTREVLMLVDTGAQKTLISKTLAQELGLEYVQEALLTGVTGRTRGWVGRLPALYLGAEEIVDLPVMVGPLPHHPLLGMDVLERLKLSVSPRSLQRTR